MASYKAYLERKKNASPYAEKANCSKCKFGEWVKTGAFCSGFGKSRKLPYSCWDSDKTGYCTQFIPRNVSSEYVPE